jgi:hypothetical protein
MLSLFRNVRNHSPTCTASLPRLFGNPTAHDNHIQTADLYKSRQQNLTRFSVSSGSLPVRDITVLYPALACVGDDNITTTMRRLSWNPGASMSGNLRACPGLYRYCFTYYSSLSLHHICVPFLQMILYQKLYITFQHSYVQPGFRWNKTRKAH